MKLLLILLALLGFTKSTPVYDENLEEFNKEFNIIEVMPEAEKAKEERRLKEMEAEINAQNEAYDRGEGHFRERLTEYSDMPREEFEKRRLGLIMPQTRATGLIMPPESERNSPENQAFLDATYDELDRQSAPPTFDSKAKGWVTPVKDQGGCGSCAAFAAAALFETSMAKAGASLDRLDLSEQYLVDCAYDGRYANGCGGAHMHAYSEWFEKDGGLSPHDSKYPYLERYPKLTCSAASKVEKWNPGVKISNAGFDYDCNEERLKQLVAAKGAVMTGIVADDHFQSYDGTGMLDNNVCLPDHYLRERLNHAVLVVGYGSENGRDYWLIKNSHGTRWGDKGFGKVQRGYCGVGNVCVWTDTKASGESDEVPPTPPPQEEPPQSEWCDMTGIVPPFTMNVTLKIFTGFEMRITTAHCKNSMCMPINAQITAQKNACWFICGRNQCNFGWM